MPLQLYVHKKVNSLLCVQEPKVKNGKIMCFQIQHYITAENIDECVKNLGGQQFLPSLKLETLL